MVTKRECPRKERGGQTEEGKATEETWCYCEACRRSGWEEEAVRTSLVEVPLRV